MSHIKNIKNFCKIPLHKALDKEDASNPKIVKYLEDKYKIDIDETVDCDNDGYLPYWISYVCKYCENEKIINVFIDNTDSYELNGDIYRGFGLPIGNLIRRDKLDSASYLISVAKENLFETIIDEITFYENKKKYVDNVYKIFKITHEKNRRIDYIEFIDCLDSFEDYRIIDYIIKENIDLRYEPSKEPKDDNNCGFLYCIELVRDKTYRKKLKDYVKKKYKLNDEEVDELT